MARVEAGGQVPTPGCAHVGHHHEAVRAGQAAEGGQGPQHGGGVRQLRQGMVAVHLGATQAREVLEAALHALGLQAPQEGSGGHCGLLWIPGGPAVPQARARDAVVEVHQGREVDVDAEPPEAFAPEVTPGFGTGGARGGPDAPEGGRLAHPALQARDRAAFLVDGHRQGRGLAPALVEGPDQRMAAGRPCHGIRVQVPREEHHPARHDGCGHFGGVLGLESHPDRGGEVGDHGASCRPRARRMDERGLLPKPRWIQPQPQGRAGHSFSPRVGKASKV